MNNYEQLRDQILPLLRPYTKQIALFGSVARGDARADSDLDILVTLKPPDQRPPLGLKWFGIEDELSRLLGRSVDLVSEEALSPYLRPYVEKDQVILYYEK